MNDPIPVVCLLTDRQLQARRRDYLDKAAAVLIDREELSGGFRFKFPLDSAVWRDLAEIVDLERRCCPFLNFTLMIEPGRDYFLLEMTGPEETREFIKNLKFFGD